MRVSLGAFGSPSRFALDSFRSVLPMRSPAPCLFWWLLLLVSAPCVEAVCSSLPQSPARTFRGVTFFLVATTPSLPSGSYPIRSTCGRLLYVAVPRPFAFNGVALLAGLPDSSPLGTCCFLSSAIPASPLRAACAPALGVPLRPPPPANVRPVQAFVFPVG